MSLEAISLGAGKRRPGRRSQYETLLKVAPLLGLCPPGRAEYANVVFPMLGTSLSGRCMPPKPWTKTVIRWRRVPQLSPNARWHLTLGGLRAPQGCWS